MCTGSRGLLTKIVDVMKQEPTTSTFRFWLARAVESYLRGSTSFCDQVFLLRRGLLQVRGGTGGEWGAEGGAGGGWRAPLRATCGAARHSVTMCSCCDEGCYR